MVNVPIEDIMLSSLLEGKRTPSISESTPLFRRNDSDIFRRRYVLFDFVPVDVGDDDDEERLTVRSKQERTVKTCRCPPSVLLHRRTRPTHPMQICRC